MTPNSSDGGSSAFPTSKPHSGKMVLDRDFLVGHCYAFNGYCEDYPLPLRVAQEKALGKSFGNHSNLMIPCSLATGPR